MTTKSEAAQTPHIVCSNCGGVLEGEEAESPRHGGGDTGTEADVLCDDCFDSGDYEFECCLCCNYDHMAYRERIGDLFVVGETLDGSRGDLAVGVYRIIEHPYWVSDYFSMCFYSDALERIADLPGEVHLGRYPCGHVCRNCADGFRKIGGTADANQH